MATGGQNDAVTADEPEAPISEHPEIFYNTSGRYEPLTGKNSAFEMLDMSQLLSDTSVVSDAPSQAVRHSSIAQHVTRVSGRPTFGTRATATSRTMSAAAGRQSRARSQLLASKGFNVVKPGLQKLRLFSKDLKLDEDDEEDEKAPEAAGAAAAGRRDGGPEVVDESPDNVLAVSIAVPQLGSAHFIQPSPPVTAAAAAPEAGALQAPSITVDEAGCDEEEEAFTISESSSEAQLSDTDPAATQAPESVDDQPATETTSEPSPPPPPPPLLVVEPAAAAAAAAVAAGGGGGSGQNMLTLPQTTAEHQEMEVVRKGGMTGAIARSFVEMLKPEEQKSEDDEDDDAAPKFKLGAIQGLRRWKQEAATRITEKKKKKLTLKGYSRNAQHYKFLLQNIENTTAELPAAMQCMLVDEALEILPGIHKAYERTVGKSHQMTRQAKLAMDSVQRRQLDFANP